MANVKIDTENLRAGGQYISKSLSENENNYNSVKSINGSPCTSLENFKESLNTKFTNYSDHSSIASEKINECADSLEQIDTFIGSNVTNLLNILYLEIIYHILIFKTFTLNEVLFILLFSLINTLFTLSFFVKFFHYSSFA